MNNYLSKLTSISSDTLIIIGLVALLGFIAFKFGKSFILSLIISVYVSILLYTNVSFVQKLIFAGEKNNSLFWNHLGILLLFLLPVFYVLRNYISSDFSKRGKMIDIFLLALACAGLIIVVFYHILPIDPIYNFSSEIDKLFASQTMFTVWLVLPILALFI